MATANLVVAASLAGLIWTIQVVHYPLFARVSREAWDGYMVEHGRRISVLVVPLMPANVIIAAALLVDDASGPAWANAALAGGVFVLTGALFAPLHGRLTPARVPRLVRLNWIRTLAWSAQVAVAAALL
jgi:hypothetical protein